MLDIGIVGLDDDMPARFALPIAQLMPTALLRLAGNAFAPLRAQKDVLELAAMQHAADATDTLIPALFAACRPGTTELDVALTVQSGIARGGARSVVPSHRRRRGQRCVAAPPHGSDKAQGRATW